jgi:hypothetical protein
MFHNFFVVNALTSLVIPSEQRRFLPVNVGVNRLWYVYVSLCKTKTYVDVAAGFKFCYCGQDARVPTVSNLPLLITCRFFYFGKDIFSDASFFFFTGRIFVPAGRCRQARTVQTSCLRGGNAVDSFEYLDNSRNFFQYRVS